MRPSELFRHVGRPIAYYPRLARVCGGVAASVLICQFLYWADKTTDPDGWVYKTQAEIQDETGLTPKEQRTARGQLGGLLEVRYDRLEHRQFYRVNTELLDEVIEAAWGADPAGAAPKVPIGTSGSDSGDFREEPSGELPNEELGNSSTGSSMEQRLHTEKNLLPVPSATGQGEGKTQTPSDAEEIRAAVLAAVGVDPAELTASATGALNKALAQLRAVRATPEEVRRRAALWPERFPSATLTATGLAKQWAVLGGQPPPRTTRASPPPAERCVHGTPPDETCDACRQEAAASRAGGWRAVLAQRRPA
jgi:hypothetical protein